MEIVIILVACVFVILLAGLVSKKRKRHTKMPLSKAATEIRVVALVVGGNSNDEIARLLGISTYEVKNILRAVYGRVGVSDRLELALRIIRGEIPEFLSLSPGFKYSLIPPRDAAQSSVLGMLAKYEQRKRDHVVAQQKKLELRHAEIKKQLNLSAALGGAR